MWLLVEGVAQGRSLGHLSPFILVAEHHSVVELSVVFKASLGGHLLRYPTAVALALLSVLCEVRLLKSLVATLPVPILGLLVMVTKRNEAWRLLSLHES